MKSETELLQSPYLARVRENVERLERGLRPLPMPKQDEVAPTKAPTGPRTRSRPAEPEPASCTRCTKVALLKAGLCGECFWSGVDTSRLVDEPTKRARVVKRERDEEPAQDLEQQLRGLEVAVDDEDQPALANEPAPQPTRANVAKTKCPVCEEEFERTHHRQVNCSRTCTIRAADQRRSRSTTGGGVVPKPRSRPAGPRVAKKAAPISALVDEIAAMQRMAEAVEDLSPDLAIKALRWVLERLEADQVVEAELAEQGEDAA